MFVLSARNKLKIEDVHEIIKTVTPKKSETLMTIAEQLIREGKKEGKKEGMDLTLQAVEAFRQGKDIKYVMGLTGMKKEDVLRIQKSLKKMFSDN